MGPSDFHGTCCVPLKIGGDGGSDMQPGGGGVATVYHVQGRIRMAVHHRRSPPPPPKTKVTVAGKNEIYRWENLVGPSPPPDPSTTATLHIQNGRHLHPNHRQSPL